MVKIIISILSLLIVGVGGIMWLNHQGAGELVPVAPLLNISMKIESSAFENNQPIPPTYTCDGENTSPPLMISGVPKEAKSLALVVDDPDAPRGLWVHWTTWNIAPDTKEIPENSVLRGAMEGMTDFGKPGYGGPCPPSGTHRYFFKLYALDTMLDVPMETDKIELEAAMIGHVVASSELIGLYSRQRK